VVARY